MEYTLRRGILVKAHRQFVWNILSDFSNKYFRHIAYSKSNANHRPSELVDKEQIVWMAKQLGEIELDRYQDINISRKINSVRYQLQSSGKYTWVEIRLTLNYPKFKFHQCVANHFVLKDVVDDNLIWLKTLIEDRFEHIYDKHNFFRNDLDAAYNSILNVAQEGNYLSSH